MAWTGWWALGVGLICLAGAGVWFMWKSRKAGGFTATQECRSAQGSMLLGVGVSCQALDQPAQTPGGLLTWIGTAVVLAGTALVVGSARQRPE